jgi:signal transduction histidine kinase
VGPELSAVGISAGVTAATAVVGAAALSLAARRSPSRAALGAPLVIVVALASGVAAATRSMLIAEDNYRNLVFVLLAGAPVAVGIGILLARRVQAIERDSLRAAADRERAELLESSRRETIRWLSHDVRTPLAGIRLLAEADLAETLGAQEEPTGAARPLPTLTQAATAGRRTRDEQIIREVDRIDAMVDDIAELSRLHADPAALLARAHDVVPLADVVSDAVAAVAPLAEAADVVIRDAGQSDVVIRCDARALTRAVVNLLRNAVQHTPAGGTIAVASDLAGGRPGIAVTDACGGIADTDLPHLFEVGWRGSDARPGGGGGLGLAIVRAIADGHGGTVQARNTPDGTGCTVRLTLAPVTPERLTNP